MVQRDLPALVKGAHEALGTTPSYAVVKGRAKTITRGRSTILVAAAALVPVLPSLRQPAPKVIARLVAD